MNDDLMLDPAWRRREGFPDRATILDSPPFKARLVAIELLFRTRSGPEWALENFIDLSALKHEHPDVPILPLTKKRMTGKVLRAAGADRIHDEDQMLWTWRYKE